VPDSALRTAVLAYTTSGGRGCYAHLHQSYCQQMKTPGSQTSENQTGPRAVPEKKKIHKKLDHYVPPSMKFYLINGFWSVLVILSMFF